MNKDTAMKSVTLGNGRNKQVITIDPEFESLIAPLSVDEYAALKASIRADGFRDHLSVWTKYPVNAAGLTIKGKPTLILLDGHTRLRIWQDLIDSGDLPETGFCDAFANIAEGVFTREEALLWIEENQAGRRNLTDDQRAVIWDSIRERRSKIVRAEQLKAARQGKPPVSSKTDGTEQPVAAEPPAPKDSRRDVARKAGISENKFKTLAALKKINPDVIKEVRAGKKTLRDAVKENKPAPAEPFQTTFFHELANRLNVLTPSISDGKEHVLVTLLSEAATKIPNTETERFYQKETTTLLRKIAKEFEDYANTISKMKAVAPKPPKAETTKPTISAAVKAVLAVLDQQVEALEAMDIDNAEVSVCSRINQVLQDRYYTSDTAKAVEISKTIPQLLAHPLPPYCEQILKMLRHNYGRAKWTIDSYESWIVKLPSGGYRSYSTEGRANSAMSGLIRENGWKRADLSAQRCDLWKVSDGCTVAEDFDSKADAEAATRYVDEEMALREEKFNA